MKKNFARAVSAVCALTMAFYCTPVFASAETIGVDSGIATNDLSGTSGDVLNNLNSASGEVLNNLNGASEDVLQCQSGTADSLGVADSLGDIAGYIRNEKNDSQDASASDFGSQVSMGLSYSAGNIVSTKLSGSTGSQVTTKLSPGTTVDATKYSYTIIPLLKPFNEYFLIKTDNPDPYSFEFTDESTVYSEDGRGSIEPVREIFSDVKYDDASTFRVAGGYIAEGSSTDGGELTLMAATGSATPVHNLTTGETTYDYSYNNTNIKVSCESVVDETDYLINTYSGNYSNTFERLDNIQSGLLSICLYNGTWIRGELKKSTTTPYYGLSTSPHVDQTFYIQDPYYHAESKPLIVSSLYPFRYDSIGFPSEMAAIAQRIDSSATYKWNSNYHWLVDVTIGSETKSYGGDGTGGGQGIDVNNINRFFSFSGSADDSYSSDSSVLFSNLKQWNNDYGSMSIPEQQKDLEPLTWSKVSSQVGEKEYDGSYVRLVLINSIFGSGGTGYTYLYNNGSDVGYFSNAWYDGRYFNDHEYIYFASDYSEENPDLFSFNQTISADSRANSKPSVIFRDYSIKIPDDGLKYYYDGTEISKLDSSKYDNDSGTWAGYMKFIYESSSDAWVSNILNHITCKDASGNRSEVSDSFKSACTLTADELNAMGVDRNKNNPPSDFLIYDMTVQPGTKGTLSNNTFINPNNGSSYAWVTRASDGAKVLYKDGKLDADEFVSDGTYTYYVNSDGTIMKNEFAWHPTENHPIYFDENGHEVFNDFKGVGDYTYFFQADGSPMTDRLTYHPDGEHIIYFDGNGHEVFSSFAHPSMTITGETIADGDQYYFNVYGYMYKNTVTYDATGTKLYYINGNGQMQHSGWFTFEDNAGYGDDPSAIWQLTGSRLGFAQYDGSLLTNASTFDYNGAPVYMQGNGEAAY